MEIQGRVERDWADRVGAWQPASLGAGFQVGDGIRTGEKSDAVLRLSEGSFVHVKTKTMIRFMRSIPGSNDRGVDVQMGEAEITAGDQSLRLRTGSGVVTMKAGSRLRIVKTEKGLDYQVEIGSASFQNAEGALTQLNAGEGLRVGIGQAVFEYDTRTPAIAQAGSKEPEQISPSAPEGVKTKETDGNVNAAERPVIADQAPRQADFSVTAGESFTVHVARPPTVVEFRFEKLCANGAVIQRTGSKGERSRGDSSANLLFPEGHWRYQMYCIEGETVKKRAKIGGTVAVTRDTGTARLPVSAPASIVDVDGRQYKIFYQNILPSVSVRWLGAPKGRAYVLEIKSPSSAAKAVKVSTPQYAFVSGSLSEGVHRIRFITEDDPSRKSKETTVEIRFDNAAPKASLREPAEGVFKPGDKVVFSGVAVPGWKLSLQSGTISLDGHYRFSGEADFTNQYRALALRLSHPKKGIHYYLRRGVEVGP